MITVVAMGVDSGDLTARATKALQDSNNIVLKSNLTHMTATIEQLGLSYSSCDELYDRAEDFDQLNQLIVDMLTACDQAVAFCVVGQGSDDSTVQYMVANNIPFQLIAGVSVAERLLPLIGSDNVVEVTATSLLNKRVLDCNNLVVKYIDDVMVASEVKIKLLDMFDYDCDCYVSNGNNISKITLEQLDRQSEYNYLTTILVVGKDIKDKKVFSYFDMLELLSTLRAPNGCQWDRAQTHQSITSCSIEEAYELEDAILNKDMDSVIEEVGDLLMQVLFHMAIAIDEGEFVPQEVYSCLGNKLVSRHTHVFGDNKATDAKEALAIWDKAKLKEHKIASLVENILDVPTNLPSLLRARKVQSRASKGGYDFASIAQCQDKLLEEIKELNDSIVSGNKQEIAMEGGDVLFAVVNWLRMLDVDVEQSLSLSTTKFANRVIACQRILDAKGMTLLELDGEQFDELWAEVKHNENY